MGDDVYGEDPGAHALERRAAELLGKESALFVPTGTMANQIALLLHCRPGDEVLVGEGNHVLVYESGAGAAFAGVQFKVVGRGGCVEVGELELARSPADYHHAPTRLLALENTHNRSGGRVLPQRLVQAAADWARTQGLGVHLDGARIWNAAAASGLSEAQLAAPADTVSACFSKGLGAPIGSVLALPAAWRPRARRLRKMLGGGMRQIGLMCAAALHALEHHRDRLVVDHQNAQRLAAALAQLPGVACDLDRVETNIVRFAVTQARATDFVAAAREAGVLVGALGPQGVRAVTHLDVDCATIDEAAQRLGRVAAALG